MTVDPSSLDELSRTKNKYRASMQTSKDGLGVTFHNEITLMSILNH